MTQHETQDETQPKAQDETQPEAQDETQDETHSDKGKEPEKYDEIDKNRDTFEKVFGEFLPISSASERDPKSPCKE